MKARFDGFEATIHTQTEKAVCVTFEHENVRHVERWIPLSVVHEDSLREIEDAVEGSEISLYVAHWFVRKHLE